MNCCERNILERDPVLAPITSKMLGKLNEYISIIVSELFTAARVVDPLFASNVLNDLEILRRHVMLLLDEFNIVDLAAVEKTNTPFEELVEGRGLDVPANDEIVRFLRATTNGDPSF